MLQGEQQLEAKLNLFPDFHLMSFKIVRLLDFFHPCMYSPVSIFVTSKGREKGTQNIESTTWFSRNTLGKCRKETSASSSKKR